MNDQDIDEMLGIVRCEQCGHALHGEIECPVCSGFEKPGGKGVLPKWIYLTACFLTSPLSIYFIIKERRLTLFEKIAAVSGCSVWFGLYIWRF